MPKSSASGSNHSPVISAEQVIDRVLDLLKAIPEAAEELPQGFESRAFWQKLAKRNARTRRMMELLRELPAFTDYAPRTGDTAGWRKLMERDFQGPPRPPKSQALHMINEIVAAGNPPPIAVPEASARKTKRDYWRDRFGAQAKFQRVRPVESKAYLHNPHRGTATFQRFQGDDVYPGWPWTDTHGPRMFEPDAPVRENNKYVPRTTVSYCRWPWAWLEPERGKYNWKLIDLALKTAHNRGQTLQVRFQPYSARVDYAIHPIEARRHPPRVSVNMPDWYWDTGAKWIAKGPYAEHEPDSNDPKYILHFGNFVRAFARRYDGHADLESIDIAYAGFWGESGGNATAATGKKLLDIYLGGFKKTRMLSLIGVPGCKFAEDLTRGTPQHTGWRADCIGDLRPRYREGCPPELAFNHTFDAYPRWVHKHGIEEAWRSAPVTLETCWAAAQWFTDDVDLDVIMREATRYHVSVFMPKSVFYPQALREKLIEFDKRIGYRFAVRQIKLPLEFKPGQPIDMEFFIDNVGCAPIYQRYALAVRFRQESGAGSVKRSKTHIVRLKTDIRKWMPGHSWFEERVITPRGLKTGETKIDLAIVDAANRPKVWFAIDEKTEDGWHPMTSMDASTRLSAVGTGAAANKPAPMTT